MMEDNVKQIETFLIFQGDEGALVSVIKVTPTEHQMLLVAIASVEKQVYIPLSSSKDFIRPMYANQDRD